MPEATRKYVVVVLLLGLIALRVIGLEGDPPLHFAGHGQAQLTDPYHLTYSARNKSLFDEWNPFDYHRWDIFKNSLVSGVSYLFFSIGDVSRFTANLSATFLHLGGFLFFILSLSRHRERWEVIVAALLLLSNSTLFFFGRLPFLENGLIFLSGLTFFVYVKYHGSWWGQILTGLLVALAALSGKLFGLLLVTPVFLTLLYEYRKKALLPILRTSGGLLLGAAAYLSVFYGGSLSTLIAYYQEQTTGMYGSPPGFASPILFMKMLLTYGAESGFNDYTMFFTIATAFSLLVILLTTPITGKYRKELIPIIFCLTWLFGGILGLMPFIHRPMRYALFLYLPMCAICSFALRTSLLKSVILKLHNRYLTLPICLIVLWYTLIHIQVFLSPMAGKFFIAVDSLLPMFVIALVGTGVIYFFFRKDRRFSPMIPLAVPLLALLAVFAVRQSKFIYDGLVHSGHQMSSYNADLAQLLNDDAVLTGPYTPALTIGNNLNGVIYMFGLSNKETDLFKKFPITHVAADRSNWAQAIKDFPFLKSSVKILQMVVRDHVISIHRLPGISAGISDFERAQIHFEENRYDSAHIYFERFNEEFPDNLFGNLYLMLTAHANGEYDRSQRLVDKMTREHPDNYMLHGFLEGFYSRLFISFRDQKYRQLADYHGRLSTSLNPIAPKAR